MLKMVFKLNRHIETQQGFDESSLSRRVELRLYLCLLLLLCLQLYILFKAER